MNIVLFNDVDICNNKIVLSDRRYEHIVNIHRAKVGDSLKVGKINGLIGTAVIDKIDNDSVSLSYELDQKPPKALPLVLVAAMSRPPTFKKVLEVATAMGVKEFYFINAKRVEQSYWQSPILHEENYVKHIYLGLEQCVDTVVPKVFFYRGFKDFLVKASELAESKQAFVAHPYVKQAAPRSLESETVLAIGPEGGFIDYEIDRLCECGFQSVHMGDRILRVEHAVSSLLSSMVKSY